MTAADIVYWSRELNEYLAAQGMPWNAGREWVEANKHRLDWSKIEALHDRARAWQKPLNKSAGGTASGAAPACPSCGGRVDDVVSRLTFGLQAGNRPKKATLKAVRSAVVDRLKNGRPPGTPPCTCAAQRAAPTADTSKLCGFVTGHLMQGAKCRAVSLRGLKGALDAALAAPADGGPQSTPGQTPVTLPNPLNPLAEAAGATRGSRDYERAALHEAAHGVLLVALGCPVKRLAVGDAAGPTRLGVCEPSESEWSSLPPAERALVALAGGGAEAWAGPGACGLRADRKAVRAALGLAKEQAKDLARLARRDFARRLAEDAPLRSAVEAVAKELAGCRGGELPGDAVARLVREAVGRVDGANGMEALRDRLKHWAAQLPKLAA